MKIIINRITRRISGAELYNVYLLGALKKYKDLEILFSSDNDTLSEKVRKMGYTISPIKPPLYEVGTKKQLLFAILLLPQYALVYWKYFRKNGNFDLIIFESMNEKIFLTFLLKLWNKKIIWIEHGPLFATRRAALIKLLYKLNSNFVDKIICVSKSTQVDLLTAGLNSGKTIVQYIGVDTQKYDIFSPQKSFRMRSKLGLLKKEIIGFLGTVNEEKGIRKFLEVATIISKVKSNAFFVIIGEGNLLEWAKSEAQKRSLSNKFYFTGFIDEIADYLGIFNILLFP
ncbi:MAG TPA: glycosyltransferase, partial [Candidatus Saccharimonadales bacterium]|nr:glycosyltransferase [Candidatus Saccharimonadales bacterium]